MAIIPNLIDIAYFPFNQRRTTYDVYNLTIGGQTDISKLLPQFLKDYWYLIIVFIVFIYVLIKIFNNCNYHQNTKQKLSIKLFTLFFVSLFFTISTATLAIRGGLQQVPIMMIDASLYTKPAFVPIVINTPFSIIKTSEVEKLKSFNYFNNQDLKKYIEPIHKADTGNFKKLNVCLLILESFSKEYTGFSNRKSYTPFLDSLLSQSLYFNKAYANGKTSISGIPAITASMPSFMETPFINSLYGNNAIDALPYLLKQKGYYSAFFHGGSNGTMNFNGFASLAGFDDYYGRNEYNNDKDYDGFWGIWDEPFLQYTIKKISEFKQPFFTTIFTLSSHNPYKVPEKYKGKFPKSDLEIIESIGYTDFALKQFFNQAKKQTWFNNTLFVITADHTGISDDKFYANNIGQFCIPIAFYYGNNLKGISNKTVSQIDILPTVLDYLNYDKSFYSLGNSMLDTVLKKPAIFYIGNNYRVILDSIYLTTNDFEKGEVFNVYQDSLMQHYEELKNTHKADYLNNYTKAFMQTYSNKLNGK